MPSTVQALPTLGEIVRRTGCQPHRIEYVIRSRGIKPTGRAGNAYVYSEADVQHIASELRRIERDRQGATE